MGRAEVPDPGQIPRYLAQAYATADAGRKGCVHLSVPVDVFVRESRVLEKSPGARPPAPHGTAHGDIQRAVSLLREAERPVVIAGSGVWWSGSEAALRRFIEHTSIPLYTITMARGTVPDDHPLVMGYADPALNHAVHTAFREADLFLVLGKRIDYRLAMGGARLFPKTARFIQVDVHEEELGLNHELDVAICADVRLALEAMTEAAGIQPWPARAWIERVRALRGEWESKLAAFATDNTSPLHPAAFFRELKTALPKDILYSWDGGDFAHWGRASIPARQGGGWIRLGPLGTIGSSLPNGVALQMAHPGRPVAVITGDGALGFYLAEMDTAVRHKLPIVLIVGNDAGWGLERELQALTTSGAPSIACELQSARYDLIMKAFGGDGETVEHLDQVRPAVARAFASGLPYCLNVTIRGVRSPYTEWQIAGKKP